MKSLSFEKYHHYALILTISSPFLMTMVKRLKDMHVARLILNFEANSSNNLLLQRFTEVKNQSYFNNLESFTYSLLPDVKN